MDFERREATTEELLDMSNSLRWAYERGQELALWRSTGVITFFGPHMTPEGIIILQQPGEQKPIVGKVMVYKGR